MNLVDEMVAARWRQQRCWAIQTASFNLQMESLEEEVSYAPARVALAFIAMAEHEKLLDLILRYETSYSRMHDRAMKALFRLRQELNLRNDPNPPNANLRNDPNPVLQPPPDPSSQRPPVSRSAARTNPSIVTTLNPPVTLPKMHAEPQPSHPPAR